MSAQLQPAPNVERMAREAATEVAKHLERVLTLDEQERLSKLHPDEWPTQQGFVDVGEIIARIFAPLENQAALRAAAQLTVLHFKRNRASGNFQGDDEHDAWEALETALAAPGNESPGGPR